MWPLGKICSIRQTLNAPFSVNIWYVADNDMYQVLETWSMSLLETWRGKLQGFEDWWYLFTLWARPGLCLVSICCLRVSWIFSMSCREIVSLFMFVCMAGILIASMDQFFPKETPRYAFSFRSLLKAPLWLKNWVFLCLQTKQTIFARGNSSHILVNHGSIVCVSGPTKKKLIVKNHSLLKA